MKCDELKAEQWLDYSGEPMPCYPKAKVDAAIEELKQKLHDAEMQADLAECAVTEYKIDCDKLKDENRRLKRALWLARAEICHRFDVDRYLRNHRNSWYNENCLTWADACVAMEVKRCKAESKCRAKAEKYK